MVQSLQEIEQRFTAWARANPDFRAAIVVGSQARPDHPADAWSDLDLILFIQGVEEYQERVDWIEALAPVWVSMLSRTAGGEPERLVLFAGGFQVDFVFRPAADLAELVRIVQSGQIPDTVRRGVRILFDKDRLIPDLAKSEGTPAHQPPEMPQFMAAWEHFWFTAVFAAKQLSRGDMAFYKRAEEWLRQSALPFLEWHAQAQAGWQADTWHNSRFAAEWLDPGLYQLLSDSYTPLEVQACWQGLLSLVACFRQAAGGVAEATGTAYPAALEQELLAYVRRLQRSSLS